ncbi:MAG: MurT ligase domain-containing protein [Erysipelotrichaceae bacterium]|nr:MurT ligase domain-containing protein [Erysipelotrichaceae bacterium]
MKYKRDNKFFFFIALWACKLTQVAMKLARKHVPYFAGNVAAKICPNFRYYLNKPKLIIAITGTNGKSTICQMFVDFFKKNYLKVVNNDGFNTAPGVIAYLADCVNIFNMVTADVAILEIDEISSSSIFKNITPNYMIVNNLMRDSIKANSTPDYVRDRIAEAIPEDTTLVINADDALCVTLGNNNSIYYGMEKLDEDHDDIFNIVNDMVLCPKCHHKLKYNYVKYNNIGNYECSCGFKRPECKYEINMINFKNNYFLMNREKYDINFNNIPNTYNVLAVISVLKELGYSTASINESFEKIKILDSRFANQQVKGKNLTSIMIKGSNPNTLYPMLKTINDCKDSKDIVFVFDDLQRRKYEVETEHWIYDVDFELLANDKYINKIIIGGPRSKYYLVRLLIAGVDKEKIIIVDEEHKVIDKIAYKDVNNIFLSYDIYSCDLALELRKSIGTKMEELG